MNVDEIVSNLEQIVATWGLKVLGGVAFLAVGWIVAALVRGGVRRALQRARVDETLAPFVANVVHALVVLAVAVGAAGVVGVPMGSFIAMIGAAGLAIALAFQGTLSNFAAGIMVLTFRPFRVGHFVEAAGSAGTVKEIGLFTTTMATPDNVQIIVPNSEVYDTTIKNYSANDTRRIDLVVGVAYGDDLNVAAETILRVLKADERVLAEPAPVVAVSAMGDSSIDFVARPWVKTTDYWAARWDLTKALKEELEAAGCSIPFPQRDVHLFQATG